MFSDVVKTNCNNFNENLSNTKLASINRRPKTIGHLRKSGDLKIIKTYVT